MGQKRYQDEGTQHSRNDQTSGRCSFRLVSIFGSNLVDFSLGYMIDLCRPIVALLHAREVTFIFYSAGAFGGLCQR